MARGTFGVKIGITCYPTYGGSGAVATELGIALAARGHEVHFITYAYPFRLPVFSPRIFFHEVAIGSYPLFQYPPYDLALAVRMHEVATQQKLDLLHVHYAIPHATSAWLAKQMLQERGVDLPVVTTLHGTDITIVGQDHSYHAITRFSIEKSDRVTAVSQYLREETVRAFGCDQRRVQVIPNFVDPAVFTRSASDDALRQQLGDGRKVLMHISNMRPVKRVTDIVQIFAAVRREIPSVLVMVGDGPDRPAAEEEARRLDVEGDVRFLGKIDGVAPLIASADLYVLTTDRESFGLSALEAQACGVPVLGYAVGGLPEVVESGVTGHLGAVGDVVGMSRAALDLLGSASRWQAMSDAAVERAVSRFATDRVLPLYEALYADAVR
ncbi:MAG: N-acetyl-alpha-D-glucosaminyl L-malate synthase BshA [Gemmatimonadaceae bacterium]